MSKRQIVFPTLMLILASSLSLLAQETRIVKVDGWAPPYSGDPEAYSNTLYNAIEADTTERKSNPDVIFELKRGHKYPQGKTIKNYDYHLHIRSEEGDGVLPELIPGKGSDGTYGADFIYAYNDLSLEDIAFTGMQPDGGYLSKMVEARGKRTRYTVKGCLFEGDREAGIVISADSMKVYISDVVVGNCGHRNTVGGGGRFLDLRPAARYIDTLVIKNSTANNISDRIIRNMGSEVNYLEIDHLTALNTVGYHGAIQLGYVRTARVTNSLFANVISLGHVDSRITEQTQPEKHFSVISLDTVFAGQVIEVRNNNIYYDKVLTDVWASYDSVSVPWAITPTIETALGAPNVDKAYFQEPLSFTLSCDPLSAFVNAYYTNPSSAAYPDNWCVGGDGGYALDEVDLSYPTNSVSYTAADNSYPVGNLNYFPGQKSAWEAESNTGIGSIGVESSFRVYPNPARDVIYIDAGEVHNDNSAYAVKLLNSLGQVFYASYFTGQTAEIDLSACKQTGLCFIQISDQTNQIIEAQKIILE